MKPNNEYIEKVKENYLSAKKILTIVADPNHPLSHQLKTSMTIIDLEKIHTFVSELEDHGVHLLFKKEAN